MASEPVERHVRSIRPAANEALVATLKEWLDQAERGELVGAVILGNLRGVEVMHSWAGLMPLDRALMAFEFFKRRNIE